MKLAIMGGTFNPPHLGHLICAEEVRDHFKFDKVIFIPNARPPHKDNKGILDPQHRYIMTCLAIKDNPNFEISRIELDRQGRSYSIETVKEYRRIYEPETEFYWIVGADSILEMPIWKDIDDLLNLCHFIGINRPGYDLSKANPRYLEKVTLFNVTSVDISASEIRKRVKNGQTIKYLVPKDVEDYIYVNGLYKDAPNTSY